MPWWSTSARPNSSPEALWPPQASRTRDCPSVTQARAGTAADIAAVLPSHNRHSSQPRVTRGSFKLIIDSLKQALSVQEAPGRQCQPSGSRTASAGALCQRESSSSRATATASVACSAEGHRTAAARLPVPLPGTWQHGHGTEAARVPFCASSATLLHKPSTACPGLCWGRSSSGKSPGNLQAEFCPGTQQGRNVTRAALLLTPALGWCLPSFGMAAKRE